MSATRILVVDDESDIRSTLKEVLSDEGHDVDVAADAGQARAARARHEPDLVLLDIWMPDTDGITLLREWAGQGALRCPVVMMSGHGTVETAVEATRLGAFDFVEKPLSLAKLLRVVERALESGRRKRLAARALVPPLVAPVGKSRLMQSLREQIQQIAPRDAAVLLLGEPGTGREAFARYLHSLSPRADKPFVAVAGGSLDEAGAAAQLRGSERDGSIEQGLYDQASGGTLYLAGLEDFSPAVQRVLAADLDAGAYVRVNGRASLPLPVRIVSSAQPGFESAGAEPFRRDLLAHLNLVTLKVPPLRDYAEDVPDLLRHYVDRLVDEERLPFRRFGVAAQNRLRNYPWPGNMAELRNLVHRLLLLGGEEEIRLEEIERELATQLPKDEPLVKQDLLALPLREAREAFERAYLQQQLQLCNGKVGQLAKRVGMERTHLYRKLRSLGVDFRQSADD
ncbi:MAG: sigma-54-dependent Fis family transcriptional regulator [Proteobacteria bacterium]|nr:sigma-54-dependent Fis family transcriptional regulator [Pseudomonadota bacterium]